MAHLGFDKLHIRRSAIPREPGHKGVRAVTERTGSGSVYQSDCDAQGGNLTAFQSLHSRLFNGMNGLERIRNQHAAMGGLCFSHVVLSLPVILLSIFSFFEAALAVEVSSEALLDASREGPFLDWRPTNAPAPLECFQVSPPILSPAEPICQQTLMVHTFNSSYGKPFVGMYSFPTHPASAFSSEIRSLTCSRALRTPIIRL